MNKWTRAFDWNHASAAPAGRPFAPGPHQYFAYLSYSHKDAAVADWLHQALEKFRVPRHLAGRLTEMGVVPKRLTPVFRDRHELAAASDLGTEIREALAASHFLIVLCSPAAAKSKWTNAEIDAFKKVRGDGCVIAAIIDGEPFASDLPGREKEECFPPALRHKYDRRGRATAKRADPLAADLREDRDGRKLGLLKIIAGMLGVGLDDLVQRDHARRQRQLAIVAAGSLGGMLITSSLAFAAIQARDSARDQRRQAESLIAFMVGDLRDKLEPIGKLDVLDGVGTRVLAYYSNQDTSELSDDALVQRSSALNLMAEVAYQRGNFAEAQQLYRQAMAGTAEAVRRAPNDPSRLYKHAQNVFYVGEMARAAGRPDQAEAAYREYKRIADRMVALAPDNAKYRMEVLYAEEDLGISLMDERRFGEAYRQFDSVIGPMQNLASLYPADSTYEKEAASALAWRSDAQRAQGSLEGAIADRQRQVDSLSELLAKRQDSDVQSRLVTAHEGLGIVLAEHGDRDRAIQELQTAAAQAEALIPVEPKNNQWKSLAASTRLQLAAVLLSTGRSAEAAQQTSAGCALAAALPAADSTAYRKLQQGSCLIMRARVALADNSAPEALSLASQALAFAKTRHSEDPASDHYRIAQIGRLIGDARQRGGDPEGAKAAWAQAIAQLPAGVAERPWEINEHAELLRRLGRTDEARSLQARLEAIGYRSIA